MYFFQIKRQKKYKNKTKTRQRKLNLDRNFVENHKPITMHNGEYMLSKIKESGVSITNVALGLDISRSTLYTWLQDEELSKSKIFKIANEIKMDVSEKFPEFVHSSELIPIRDKLKNVELFELKDKYLELLEKYSSLQEKNLELEKKIAELQD